VLRAATALVLAVCVLVVACGEEEEGVPEACTGGARPFLDALARAPRAVQLDGGRISTCLSRDSDAGELQSVGAGMVGAAASLARSARRRRGQAALRLGYLIGAARRGAAPTEGIHSELLRRLDQEAAGLERSPTFRSGLRAGGRTG
jgi:hypothetical protein